MCRSYAKFRLSYSVSLAWCAGYILTQYLDVREFKGDAKYQCKEERIIWHAPPPIQSNREGDRYLECGLNQASETTRMSETIWLWVTDEL